MPDSAANPAVAVLARPGDPWRVGRRDCITTIAVGDAARSGPKSPIPALLAAAQATT